MADTSSSSRVISGKGMNAKVVVPMKLFATWEVDRTSPNCIPRLCSLRLTRLCVLKPLENDLSSLIIAVRMQSSKRTLRSNEIVFSSSKNLETELDLSFSLQYPHFLKRDGNRLQVMLQRRKRYKNRTILGYKTLATGDINMSEVLQRSKDSELRLYNQTKETEKEVAVVKVLGLSSQPVDQLSKRPQDIIADGAYNESDDDDDSYYSDQDNSDSGENLETQELDAEEDGKSSRTKQIAHRRNLKQKFISLLKRLKVASDESDTDQYQFPGQAANADDDSLYGDLDELNMSDSEPDVDLDDVSIESTPKPVLRPFFSQNIPTSVTEAEVMDIVKRKTSENGFNQESEDTPSDESLQLNEQPPPKSVSVGTLALSSSGGANGGQKNINRPRSSSNKEKQGQRQTHRSNSLNYSDHTQEEARKSLADRLSLLWPHNDSIPEKFILVNATEWQGQVLSHKLQQEKHRVVCTFSSADVEDTMLFLVTKIQKFCNQNPKVPRTIKLVICGGEGYVGTILRPYVEQFSTKSPDWQKYVSFYIIPLGNSSLGKYLGAIDSKYHSMFVEPSWRELFDKDQQEANGIVSRVSKYLSTATCNHQLRIGEVMVNYKLKSTGTESTQKFIPFINSVTIGANSSTVPTSFSEPEDSFSPLSTSPKEKDGPTPPSSPATNTDAVVQQRRGSLIEIGSSSPPAPAELMDLQVEYWPMFSGMKKDKSSLKTTFRSLIVNRLSSSKGQSDSSLSMTVVTRERNKKSKQVMRIGKKHKDSEKSQVIDGIYRLVCTSKSQSNSLTVNIDGNELTGVKFFQLTAQTHSHIKQFPVIVFAES
ncbi:phosphofurin acidic cluster sorting protein 2-like isoform X2 [Anneissia japonica]|uniref:phosphofurin acidic cluster sorting protein 2-like isoform X2 n=1 Tax=Anneissia japonica TaxID=1529436 RepID=UPI00142558D4|nr:phosphofurin acidic cluster sorting protein 2-like isoform X2 [Anneissia japonica]